MKSINSHSTVDEIKAFAEANDLNPTEVRHAQVAYLYHVECIARSAISAITGYACSTLSTMRNKVYDLLDKAKVWFGKAEHVVKNAIAKVADNKAEQTGNWFYLVRFFNCGKLIFSKIGTTERTIKKRMTEHMSYYNKHDLPVDNVIVDRVYDCGNIPTECFESKFRSYYILKHPNTFKKNDRFFDVEFDLEEADKIVESIFAEAQSLAVA